MSNKRLHSMVAVPEGKTLADLIPALSAVKGEIRIGTPNPECASCRLPFDAVRKPRKAVRMCPIQSAVPIIVELRICGRCHALHQAGGAARDGVLAAIQAYCEEEQASQ